MSTRFDSNKRPPHPCKIELHSPTCKTTQSLSPLTKPIYLFAARRRCRLLKQTPRSNMHCCSKLCYNLNFWRQSTEESKTSSCCELNEFHVEFRNEQRRKLIEVNLPWVQVSGTGQIIKCHKYSFMKKSQRYKQLRMRLLYSMICFDVAGINYYFFSLQEWMLIFFFWCGIFSSVLSFQQLLVV